MQPNPIIHSVSVPREEIEKVTEFLTKGPLYATVCLHFNLTEKQVIYNSDMGPYVAETVERPTIDQFLPKTLSRECEFCAQKTNWVLVDQRQKPFPNLFSYKCKNCEPQTFQVWINFDISDAKEKKVTLTKIGQFPKFDIHPPKEIEEALGPHKHFYSKGMTCRHHNFGIGALIYFRRIIEETSDGMIDMVVEALRESPVEANQDLIPSILAAKGERQFDKKIKVVADYLPEHMRPGGQNPFGLLFQLLSKGIHQLSDEDCIGIVDDMHQTLLFVFEEFNVHVKKRKAFTESVKKLQGEFHEKQFTE